MAAVLPVSTEVMLESDSGVTQVAHGMDLPGFWKRASARARNNSRQRGKKSERVAVPDLITKRIAKEGVGSPLGEIGRLQPYEEANS